MGKSESRLMYEDKQNKREHEFRLQKLNQEKEKRANVEKARKVLGTLRDERRALEVQLEEAKLSSSRVKFVAKQPVFSTNGSMNGTGTIAIEAGATGAKIAVDILKSRGVNLQQIDLFIELVPRSLLVT